MNACDGCTYPLAGNGGGLCCTCAADPWFTPAQEAELEARIAARLAEPVSTEPPF